jgi:hypothetical protein
MPRPGLFGFKTVYLMIATGCTMLTIGLQRFRRKRRAEDLPRAKIVSAPQGLVELQGFAWPLAEQAVQSIFEKSCVYRFFQLEKLTRLGKSLSREVMHTEKTTSRFIIFDSTGFALIDPTNWSFEAKTHAVPWEKLSASVQNSIVSQIRGRVKGFPPRGYFASTFQVVEKVLLVGSPIYANGNFISKGAGKILAQAGLREFSTKVIQDEPTFLRSLDSNQDGSLDEGEALTGCYNTALAVKLDPQLSNVSEEIYCVGQLENSQTHPLDVADCHQEHLIKRLGKNNLPFIVGGAVLIAVGVWIMVKNF